MSPVSRLRQWLLTGRLPEPGSVSEAMSLVEAARLQGLAGLLHASLPPGGAWPAEAVAALGEMRRQLTALALRQGVALERTLGLLAAAGQRALPLKGAALVGFVYDDTGERPMADLDLLAVDSFEAALRALDDAGWRTLARADHAVALAEPETGVMVELHLGPTSCPGFYPVEPLGLWERSVPLEADARYRRPASVDLLVLLCLHLAFQHGLRLPLLQFLDLRRVLERSRVDEETLVARAQEWRAEGALWAALAASARLAGTVPSRGLLERLRRRAPAGLVRHVEAWLSDPDRLSGPTGDLRGAELGRMRWLLVSGRRIEWLRRTLRPAAPGGAGRLGRAGAVCRRAIGLVRRWGPTLARPRG